MTRLIMLAVSVALFGLSTAQADTTISLVGTAMTCARASDAGQKGYRYSLPVLNVAGGQLFLTVKNENLICVDQGDSMQAVSSAGQPGASFLVENWHFFTVDSYRGDFVDAVNAQFATVVMPLSDILSDSEAQQVKAGQSVRKALYLYLLVNDVAQTGMFRLDYDLSAKGAQVVSFTN